MSGSSLKNILIVGGGTAGWMTAAALAHKLAPLPIRITLVESDEIGTVGVGEATVPHIRFFNQTLGINEAEFMRQTKATFKLGIEFRNWARVGDSYIHPFGAFGAAIDGVDFHQLWLRARLESDAGDIADHSLPILMARTGKFAHPSPDPASLLSTYSYAYQFDAGLYGRFLRAFAENRGVRRVEGRIVDVRQGSEDGFVQSVELDSGICLNADLFVDCSGFRSLLVGQAMGSKWQSWKHWLPCDRAVAIPCAGTAAIDPLTRATAREAGWMWRIPLQHRVGNGHVYSSAHLSDADAEQALIDQLDGEPLAAPNRLRFEAGKRERQWAGNCVAIGLASGFLEPLESTSIHLIQLAIGRLLEYLPLHGPDPIGTAEFNRQMDIEYERIRDFLILHYCATERSDTPFWDHCRTMALPDSLTEKIALFRERGIVARYREGMFLEPSWLAVYLGQRILPERYDPRCDRMDRSELAARLQATASACANAAAKMPSHVEALRAMGAATLPEAA
ncbi:tryptophan halogenase family protein [Sphingomonas sp. LHG3406-1]|uniref:tryptophan halogenase family protein n=1 Tax=Sphingomonas sp. LHG3406-1 TaxID=2804617 RepID=UPI00262351FE|nr:tryptophan halogenase family protein [Sphingomonas sp. LHG3406-1]